ncbi:MAG: deoxyribonuclease IV, partial [Muribaculaceae bacterium]|nr:deoxyribonuclease IV [Muribaculaceae bacterium]
FEQLAHIIDKIEDKSRIGVCIDTCHAYSAGFDLVSSEGYERTWKLFDHLIGFQYLKGMHLNDDKRELGSRIDRHESIGKGTLGTEFFIRLVNDPRFDNIPLILETPNEAIWAEEIAWLYSQIRKEESPA